MFYIKAENIKMSFEERKLFTFDQLEIGEKDRVGIVGLNGTGKTTLLNILYGIGKPDQGTIKRTCEIAYYQQFGTEQEKENRKDRLSSEFFVSDLVNANRKLVSGGEDTRLRLAGTFNKQANVVFVDEPTSNLDRKGITLVKEKLAKLDCFLLITHERELLEELCNRIIEIKDQTLYYYNGNYSDYKRQSAEREKRKQKEYDCYEQEKERLLFVYEQKKKAANDIGKAPRKMSKKDARLRNFLASRPYDVKQLSAERQAKAVLKRIEHMEVKEKPKQVNKITMDFSLTDPPENKAVIEGKNLSFYYGETCILNNVKFRIPNGAKVAVVGENGVGKTTLLNCIERREDGITIVPKARIGYFHQKFEELREQESVLWNIMRDCIQSESAARSILARLLLGARFMDQKVASLSGGEKVKLSFAKLLVSDANVLLLDEPTNYLDVPSVEAMTELLKEYEGTVLLVSHDKSLIDEVADRLLVVKDQRLLQHEGNLSSYERSLHRDKKQEQKELQIQILEMRAVALVSRLSIASAEEREKLEQEYQTIIASLQQLKIEG